MNPIKFYRVETLPETGEVGGVYFTHGDQNRLYVCTEEGYDTYTPTNISNTEIDTLFNTSTENT